jgi:endonuclease/exonuclease/phosphatase family metal-dependent hydrolase
MCGFYQERKAIMPRVQIIRTLEAGSILLFLIQALRVLFSVLFGIIYDQIFEGPMNAWLAVSLLLVIVAFLTPTLVPRRNTIRWLGAFAILAAIARVPMTINDATVRYWSALMVIAFASMYLFGFLQARHSLFLPGMIGALVADQLMRVAGDTYDVSLMRGWLAVQILWGIMICGSALRWSRGEEETSHGGLEWLGGLALGGFLFLETSLLSLPNGIARWSSTPYSIIAPLLIAVTLLPLQPTICIRLRQWSQSLTVRWCLAISLLAGICLGYFTKGAISCVGLFVAQAAGLAVLVRIFSGQPHGSYAKRGSLSLGLFLFLLLNFFNAFAFTYPYVLPIMRNMGWAIYLLAGFFLGVKLLLVQGEDESVSAQSHGAGVYALVTILVVAVAIGFAWPRTAQPLSSAGGLRSATYNIHYGYDDDWHFTLGEMARSIESAEVDVIALQEVDTGRMTSYCVDDAYYLSRRLGMNVAYLPAVEKLTGIALLYRGPESPSEYLLLTSLQEQTGIVHIRLNLSDNAMVDSYGIWMGLSDEDTMRQIREALTFIGNRERVTFGGDFNAEPDSPIVEAILAADFADPFLVLGIDPAPPTSPAIQPDSRIDYVWLRGLSPSAAQVSDSLASDHRMVVVEATLLER